jgi:hypothetical protein
MKCENGAIGAGRVMRNLVRRVLKAPDGSVQPIDQRIKLLRREPVQAAEVSDQLDPDLSFRVAMPLHQLEIASTA